MRAWPFALALIVVVAIGVPSCAAVMRTITGSRVTGTCEGACERYVDCKSGSTMNDQARCLRECPEVFSDSESIGAFESLECPDLVGFVDGDPAAHAELASPAAPWAMPPPPAAPPE